MAEEHVKQNGENPTPQAATNTPKISWDDSQMRSSYANVCNVASTREEVVLLFGINQAWHGNPQDVTVQLSDRIILSPHAAKRLNVLLTNLLREHEARFGGLGADVRRSSEPVAQASAS